MLAWVVLAAKGKSEGIIVHILPCLWCGSYSPDFGHENCQHYGFKDRPKKWDQQIESLATYPVTDMTGLGELRRLKMLKVWSLLPKKGKISKVPSDPKEFHKIDVDAMPEGVVYSWCAIFNIVARDAKKARQELKRKFTIYATGTMDVYTTNVDISHPYRCSKFPNDNRTALMHTAGLVVDPNNVFKLFGTRCPEEGCDGTVDPDIMG